MGAASSITDWLSAIAAAVAAVGTVGSLIFLGIQAKTLARQVREEAQARRTAFRVERTPFLSVEAGLVKAVQHVRVSGREESSRPVHITLHADGAGVAHNVIVNFFQISAVPSWRTLAIRTVPFLRAPTATEVILFCPEDTPVLEAAVAYRIEVSYLNMFNERTKLAHSARFRTGRAGSEVSLQITDAPVYTWPWETLIEQPSSTSGPFWRWRTFRGRRTS